MAEAVKAIGRRLFARATMGVPLVLKSAGMGGNQPAGVFPPGHPGVPLGDAQAGGGNLSLASRIWDAILKATRSNSERRELVWTKRQMMGGLDPDLSILNSMSHQHRVLRQLERNKAEFDRERSLRHTIIKGLGGNPEEYE